MTVETASYISQLNSAYPDTNDVASEGDNHMRLVKSVLQTQFPNLGATAVTSTAAEINTLANIATSGTGASGMYVATPATATTGKIVANADLVDAKILASSGITAVLPGQGGNSGKFLTTNGTSANWRGIERNWQWACPADGTTFTSSSPQNNIISSTPWTVTLPNATTMTVGDQWHFETGANQVLVKFPSGLLCAANTTSSGSGGITTSDISTSEGQYTSYGGVKRAPIVLATATVSGADYCGMEGFGLIGGVGAVASKTDTVDYSVIPFTLSGTTVTTGTPCAVTTCVNSAGTNFTSIALLSTTRYIQAVALGSASGLRFNLGSIAANVATKVGGNVTVSAAATIANALSIPVVSSVGAVAVYPDSVSASILAVGVIDNTTVAAAGTPITVKSGTTGTPRVSACKLATDKALAIYSGATATTIFASVLSLSGTTLSAGTEVTATSTGGIDAAMGRVIQLSTDKALIVYSNTSDSSYLTGVVVTVSGTVPSFGTPTRLAAVVPTYDTLTAAIAKSDGSLVNVTSGLNIVSVRVSGTTLTPLDASTYATQTTSVPVYVQDGRVMSANRFFEVAA